MTAYALKGDQERCLSAGMDSYVSKPVNGDELIEMVERLAEQPAGPQEEPAGQSATGTSAAEAVPSAAPPTVFDLDDAVKHCFGMHDIFQEMAECLLCEADPLLEQMRTALATGSATEMGNAAHRLKGTVGYLAPHLLWMLSAVSSRWASPASLRGRLRQSNELLSRSRSLELH